MKIENYREQAPGGYAVALFDVYIPAWQLTFRNLKLCMSKKGKHFIGYPSFSVEDDMSGDKKWTQYFDFSPEKKKEFENKIFEEIGVFVKGPICRFVKD